MLAPVGNTAGFIVITLFAEPIVLQTDKQILPEIPEWEFGILFWIFEFQFYSVDLKAW